MVCTSTGLRSAPRSMYCSSIKEKKSVRHRLYGAVNRPVARRDIYQKQYQKPQYVTTNGAHLYCNQKRQFNILLKPLMQLLKFRYHINNPITVSRSSLSGQHKQTVHYHRALKDEVSLKVDEVNKLLKVNCSRQGNTSHDIKPNSEAQKVHYCKQCVQGTLSDCKST